MGWLELAELLKWPAIVAGALVLVIGLFKWLKGSVSKGVIARDDLEEAEADQAAYNRSREAMRAEPTGARALADKFRRMRDAASDDKS